MKINEIVTNEMTQKIGSLDKLATNYVNQNKDIWLQNGEYIADMEDYKILKYGMVYSIWDSDILIATTSLDDTQPIPVVDKVWVNPDYRGKGMFARMMWFYKTRLNYHQLLLGSVHSKDMQEVVKHMHKFNKFWYNGEEKIPFDPDNTDEFYSYTKPTEWKILLENNGKFGWPMFKGTHFIMDSYEWPLEPNE